MFAVPVALDRRIPGCWRQARPNNGSQKLSLKTTSKIWQILWKLMISTALLPTVSRTRVRTNQIEEEVDSRITQDEVLPLPFASLLVHLHTLVFYCSHNEIATTQVLTLRSTLVNL
jgi:hypothetical protein